MLSFNAIKRLSLRSDHHNFRHVAVLTRGSSVVAIGFNHNTIHAEDAVLRRVWPDQRAGLTLWSYRVTRGGRLSMARPCVMCQAMLLRNGIIRVRYSDSNGKMIKLNLAQGVIQ